MALSDNMRLYDIAVRKQLYVEALSLHQSREFDYVLAQLAEELRKLLGRVRYRTLDGLTKAELNKFVAALRRTQFKLYSKYTEDVLKLLNDFMLADLEISRRAFATVQMSDDEDDDEAVSDADAQDQMEALAIAPLFGVAAVTNKPERLWSAITSTPIAANGLLLLPFLKHFSTSAQASVENIVRKAWANGWTVDETMRELLGDSTARQGTPSQLQRVKVQASAVLLTALSHVSGFTTAGTASTLYRWYVWASVMDNRTTDICRSRDGRVYEFGKGPLPPAHIRCRSQISPITQKSIDQDEETFYGWFARQPEEFVNDAFRPAVVKSVRSGKTKAKDLANILNLKPIDLKQFRTKLALLLSRRRGAAN